MSFSHLNKKVIVGLAAVAVAITLFLPSPAWIRLALPLLLLAVCPLILLTMMRRHGDARRGASGDTDKTDASAGAVPARRAIRSTRAPGDKP
jgi:hypothetical protein